MTSQTEREFETARLNAKAGMGWANTPKTQSERDGHAAGLLERQLEQSREHNKVVERSLEEASAARKAEKRERDVQDRLEQEEHDRRRWEAKRRVFEARANEQLARAIVSDLTLLGGQSSLRVERDAYWFLRAKAEAFTRSDVDLGLAQEVGRALDGSPPLDAAEEPAAPISFLTLGVALLQLRRVLMDAGCILPFSFSDTNQVLSIEPGELALVVDLSGDVPPEDAPAWLKLGDAPVRLAARSSGEDGDEHGDGAAFFDTYFDADMTELRRRSTAPVSEATWHEVVGTVRTHLAAAVADGLFSPALVWVEWQRWEFNAKAPAGHEAVAGTPREALAFLRAHGAVLHAIAAEMDPNALRATISAPTEIELSQFERLSEHLAALEAWAAGSSLEPPAAMRPGDIGLVSCVASVSSLSDQLRTASYPMEDLREAARDAFGALPAELAIALRSSGPRRADAMVRVSNDLQARYARKRFGKLSPGEDQALQRSVLRKVEMVAKSLVQAPTPNRWATFFMLPVACAPAGAMCGWMAGSASVGAVVGAALGAIIGVVAFFDPRDRPPSPAALESKIAAILKWAEPAKIPRV